MQKTFTAILLAAMCSVALQAQDTVGDSRLANIDWKEDTAEITTVRDIVRMQQAVTDRTAQAGHFAKVWSHRGFFNIAYHTKGTLTPNEDIPTGLSATGYNQGLVPQFSRQLGLSLMVGKNIKLHKPISQIAAFSLDFTGMDLSFDYYKAENGGNTIYNSASHDGTNADGRALYYPHWNSKKYQIGYGMSLGPSLTLAPFTHISGARGLHYLRFNVYYHIGYRASFMLFTPDKDEDMQKGTLTDSELEARNHIQFMLGHGLCHAIGFGMSWKRIGLGYEHSFGKCKYKSIGDKDFAKRWYDFKTTTNRVYLTYRFGK